MNNKYKLVVPLIINTSIYKFIINVVHLHTTLHYIK